MAGFASVVAGQADGDTIIPIPFNAGAQACRQLSEINKGIAGFAFCGISAGGALVGASLAQLVVAKVVVKLCHAQALYTYLLPILCRIA